MADDKLIVAVSWDPERPDRAEIDVSDGHAGVCLVLEAIDKGQHFWLHEKSSYNLPSEGIRRPVDTFFTKSIDPVELQRQIYLETLGRPREDNVWTLKLADALVDTFLDMKQNIEKKAVSETSFAEEGKQHNDDVEIAQTRAFLEKLFNKDKD